MSNKNIVLPNSAQARCDICINQEDCEKKLKYILPILDWILGIQMFTITITKCRQFIIDPKSPNIIKEGMKNLSKEVKKDGYH